jgi:hypothetical protein
MPPPIQTVVPFTERDLTPFDMARHFKLVCEEDLIPAVGQRLVARGVFPQKEITNIRVVLGESVPTNARFNIRIVPGAKTVEWLATQVRKDAFTTHIDCITRVVTDREAMDQIISEFGGAVHNWFLQIDNLQFTIRGLPSDIATPVQSFDSWASNIMPGFSADGALRIARITLTNWINVFYRASQPSLTS